MKVFISWSGALSKEIAETIRKWLPSVLQAVKPYFSPDDIAKGSRWSGEIAKNLEESKLGIFCVTPDNAGADWMLFEAGAISRSVEKSKVIPLLFGLEPSDLTGPYTQFQAAPFNKEEVLKILKAINSTLESQALADEVLREVFEMWWPKLNDKVAAVLKAFEESGELGKGARRPEREMLEEVLLLTRRLSRDPIPRTRRGRVHPGAYADLLTALEQLVEAPLVLDFASVSITRILEVTGYLIGRTDLPEESLDALSERLHLLKTSVEERLPDVSPSEVDSNESKKG